MKTLILNFKNYPSIQGKGSLRLAQAAERASMGLSAKVIVAPPTPMLGFVASKVGVAVFGQSVDAEIGDKTTGAVLPNALKAAGASGTILNHSESRLPSRTLGQLVPRLRKLGLETCLCARDSREVGALAGLGTEYLAVEPPALIGSGIAVSKAQPRLVEQSVRQARNHGYRGKILCGAGIVDGADVARAIELGVDGVLVASSVVNSKNWTAKLTELLSPLE